MPRHAPRAFAAALSLLWLAGSTYPARASIVPGSPTAAADAAEKAPRYYPGGDEYGPLLDHQMADDPESPDAIPGDDQFLDYIAGILGERPNLHAEMPLDLGFFREAAIHRSSGARFLGPPMPPPASGRGRFPRPLDFVGAGVAMLSAATLLRRKPQV